MRGSRQPWWDLFVSDYITRVRMETNRMREVPPRHLCTSRWRVEISSWGSHSILFWDWKYRRWVFKTCEGTRLTVWELWAGFPIFGLRTCKSTGSQVSVDRHWRYLVVEGALNNNNMLMQFLRSAVGCTNHAISVVWRVGLAFTLWTATLFNWSRTLAVW